MKEDRGEKMERHENSAKSEGVPAYTFSVL